jgi:hypothetical protein
MAKKIINTGSSANRGDGDPLRTAFNKINDNFTELYADVATLGLKAGTGGTLVVNAIQGSVIGDDSTLLVDAINSSIPKANVESSTDWDTAFSWGDHAAAGYLTSETDSQTLSLVGTDLSITNGNTVDLSGFLTSYTETDPVVGAVTGIVKADGAGNISAAVAGTDYLQSETIDLATLKTEVAACIDFTDFQARIAAL